MSRMCLMEKLFIGLGFVLIHDGQRNPGQFNLPPEEVKFFTRKYRLSLDGEFVNTWAVFRYDERSNFADFEITSREPMTRGKQRIILTTEGETQNGAQDRMSTMSGNTPRLAELRQTPTQKSQR